jgi:capsid protein
MIKLVRDVRRYPARDSDGNRQVLHLYDPDRVSQTRGVTVLAPIAKMAGMADDLAFAQLVKAQVASCYAILHNRSDEFEGGPDVKTGDQTTEPRPDGSTRIVEGTAPGMHIYNYPGEEMTGFSPNVPNAEYFAHMTQILGTIAVNLDLPLAVLLLDPSKTNFSGWRGAMDQAKIGWRALQKWLITWFHGPIYRFKVRQWQADDPALRSIGDKALEHRFAAPGWPYIEPLKDRTAELLAVRNALTSHRRRCAERGADWEDLSTEIVEDNALMIVKAQEKAVELNKKFPGLGITWREVACLPTPDGVQISIQDTDFPTSAGNPPSKNTEPNDES